MKSIKVLGLAAVATIMFSLCGCSSKTVLENKKGERLEPDQIKVGKTIKFGDYHGAEEWLVIDIDDGKALLLAEKVVDAKAYDDDNSDWETSDLREWLNSDYLEEAFDDSEQKALAEVDGDRVFILTLDQANELLDRESKRAYATDYAIDNGVQAAKTKASIWWVNTPLGTHKAQCIETSTQNSFIIKTKKVKEDNIGVRPAVWVEIG